MPAILKKCAMIVDSIRSVKDRDHWLALVNTIMNLWVPLKPTHFSLVCETG
jgi:hypothetical protein